MMFWIVVFVLIGLAIWAAGDGRYARRSSKPSAKLPGIKTKRSQPKLAKPYAALIVGENFQALTAQEVEAKFAPLKVGIREWLTFVRKLQASEERADNTGDIDHALAEEATTALSSIRTRLSEMEALWDALAFERESSSDRFYKSIEDLQDIESDVEEFIRSMADLERFIASGDFEPSLPPKAKRQPRS